MYIVVEIAKSNGVNVSLFLPICLRIQNDRKSDEELELQALWVENTTAEKEHHANAAEQSYVNCQGRLLKSNRLFILFG